MFMKTHDYLQMNISEESCESSQSRCIRGSLANDRNAEQKMIVCDRLLNFFHDGYEDIVASFAPQLERDDLNCFDIGKEKS